MIQQSDRSWWGAATVQAWYNAPCGQLDPLHPDSHSGFCKRSKGKLRITVTVWEELVLMLQLFLAFFFFFF